MMPLLKLKVESVDGHPEPSSSFVSGSDNETSLYESSRDMFRPLPSTSTPHRRILKHNFYRNSNNDSKSGFLEYENATDIRNSTFNNVSLRLEKPEVFEDHHLPVVDDESKLKNEPNKLHSSAIGINYHPETDNAPGFSSAPVWSESHNIDKQISSTAKTNLPSVPEIVLPLNMNITLAPISDLTKESNSIGLVNEDGGVEAFTIQNTEPAVVVNYENTETVVPLTEEITETVAPAIEEIIETVAPVMEGDTETVVPVMEGVMKNDLLVIEGVTRTVGPVMESVTDSTVSVMEDVTETVVPVMEGVTETTVPVMEGVTDTVVPVMEGFTDSTVLVIEEHSGTDAPIVEVQTYTAMHDLDENVHVYVPITDESRKILEFIVEENTEAGIPFTLENTEIYEPRTEENTEIDESRTEENTEIYESRTENKTEMYESRTEENTEIFESVNEESWQDVMDAAVLSTDKTTQTVQKATNDVMDQVSSAVQDTQLDSIDIAGINTRIQAYSSTHESKLVVNSTDLAEHNVILEASPQMVVLQDTLSAPLEPATIDVKIKTIKDLQVDVHDLLFDPSQIAKATSYEESSYSTATRSATVTTWVDPNNRNVISQGYANLTQLRVINISSEDSVPSGQETNTVNVLSHLEITTGSPILTSDGSNQMHGIEVTAIPIGYTYNDFENHYSRQEDMNIVHKAVTESIDSNIGNNETSEIPTLELNIGGIRNVSGANLQSAESNAEDNFVYEIPELNRNPGLHMTSSIVIALSICCSVVVILSILTMSLWLRRRHKNRSKIYLSQESVKPKAFFTKPMHPALLPDESLAVPDSLYVIEFQKPRAPVVLSDDPDCMKNGKETILESQTDGIENHAFVDIPLEDLKPKNLAERHIKQSQNPPKFGSKSLLDSNSNSGIKVWSSTGSLYRASPEFCHCPVPPPPYSSSSGDDSVNLSADAFPSIGSKSRLLYV